MRNSCVDVVFQVPPKEKITSVRLSDLGGHDQQHSLGRVAGVLGTLVWHNVQALHFPSNIVSILIHFYLAHI